MSYRRMILICESIDFTTCNYFTTVFILKFNFENPINLSYFIFVKFPNIPKIKLTKRIALPSATILYLHIILPFSI
jgi:hypothetical protein